MQEVVHAEDLGFIRAAFARGVRVTQRDNQDVLDDHVLRKGITSALCVEHDIARDISHGQADRIGALTIEDVLEATGVIRCRLSVERPRVRHRRGASDFIAVVAATIIVHRESRRVDIGRIIVAWNVGVKTICDPMVIHDAVRVGAEARRHAPVKPIFRWRHRFAATHGVGINRLGRQRENRIGS